MNDIEQKKAAKEFANFWEGKGYEKGQSQSFWLSLLHKVFGVEDPEKYITFEDQVHLDHTSFIDGYINNTKVLIEQKSLDKDLSKAIKQSDGSFLTPFQQAKRYITELPVSKHPRWVVTCNFESFYVYDMEKPGGDPEIIFLKDLPKEYYRLQFLVDKEDEHLNKEMEISLAAGEIVGELYEAFSKQYVNPNSAQAQYSLNVLCVRIVFCLYAEDAGLFGSHGMFYDYLSKVDVRYMRKALKELFKVLDTPSESRDPYLKDDSPLLAAFPYVNGGLFADENIEIPPFTDEIRNLLLEHASADFDWSEISPTIFGAVFESTLNPETRRSGGMHYTSIENIHKLIDPLFLDDLKNELQEIKNITIERTKKRRLKEYQRKLSELKFLDPACGSGNFLTETYLSLRRLENQVIALLVNGQMGFGFEEANPIMVSINQFYGIEINDFAATVAKTALWIAESQTLKETEEIILMNLDFLPLKSYTNIVEGNALRLNWEEVVPKYDLNYIMGNPPFIGQAMRSKEQANDIMNVFAPSKAGGKLDYVAGWFKKASDMMHNTNIETAFVSSNSICQGESVNLLWEPLLTADIRINFAHNTFLWTSEAADKAAVMCVIIGFSEKERNEKLLFEGSQYKKVSYINGYLNDAPNIFIKNRSKSINSNLAKVVQGSPPADDGRLLLSATEKELLISKYPELQKVIKPFIGSREFINETEFTRYCFWFEDENPADYIHIPEVMERFDYVKEYRLKSSVDRIRKTANKPYLFTQNRQPSSPYLFIPRVSSSSRRYIPIGFLPENVIASDSAVLVYNASLYDFGIICSNMHNAWMRTIAGRLKNDYRYAPSVYYNFPFPKKTDESYKKIVSTAQKILDARKIYAEHSLAEMYGNKMYLFPELLKAHQLNDKAVMEAYGITSKSEEFRSESACVAMLMNMYKDLTEK